VFYSDSTVGNFGQPHAQYLFVGLLTIVPFPLPGKTGSAKSRLSARNRLRFASPGQVVEQRSSWRAGRAVKATWFGGKTSRPFYGSIGSPRTGFDCMKSQLVREFIRELGVTPNLGAFSCLGDSLFEGWMTHNLAACSLILLLGQKNASRSHQTHPRVLLFTPNAPL